jgi:hypothetical protein
MPTIELFDSKRDDGDWFLAKSEQTNRIVLLWIVDSKESLRKALSMQNIHGVISNHPTRLKKMYESICEREYSIQNRSLL